FGQVASLVDLQPRRPDLHAARFSGGNQQKLVLGRWMQKSQPCSVLLLDEPTQGVDVGARRDLYVALRRFRDAPDRAIILTSSEPDELIQVADRVVVLSCGRIAGIATGSDINEKNLLHLAHFQDEAGNVA